MKFCLNYKQRNNWNRKGYDLTEAFQFPIKPFLLSSKFSCQKRNPYNSSRNNHWFEIGRIFFWSYQIMVWKKKDFGGFRILYYPEKSMAWNEIQIFFHSTKRRWQYREKTSILDLFNLLFFVHFYEEKCKDYDLNVSLFSFVTW